MAVSESYDALFLYVYGTTLCHKVKSGEHIIIISIFHAPCICSCSLLFGCSGIDVATPEGYTIHGLDKARVCCACTHFNNKHGIRFEHLVRCPAAIYPAQFTDRMSETQTG